MILNPIIMAKATVKTKEDNNVEETVVNTEETSGKMSRKEAEAIVKKYEGINGTRIPELEQAKKVLKG